MRGVIEEETMNSNPMMNFFQKLRLPLNRGEQNIYTFLHSHFEKFDEELEILLGKQGDDRIFDQQIYREIKGRRETIHSFYRAILGVLKAYSNGEILAAHRIFEDKMNEMQDCIAFLNLKGYRLFRIKSR